MKVSHALPRSQCPRPSGTQSGLSLVELMVAMAVGLVVIASLAGILTASSGSSHANDRTSEMATNGSYALTSLKDELHQAGFLAYTSSAPGLPDPWIDPGSGCADPGSTIGSFVTNISQGIWGADNSNPFAGASNCIPSANYVANNDVLVIRHLGTMPVVTLEKNAVYFESAYAQGRMFKTTSAPVVPDYAGSSQAAIFPVRTYVYYVCPFTTTATESPKVPALWRLSLQDDGTMVRELVAGGIERMQVQYGIMSTAGQVQFYDSIPGSASQAPAEGTPVSWGRVSAVRIWLLVRNATAEPGYANAQTYDMGNQPYTVNDGFRRQLLTTVVQLRNARPQP